MTFLTNLTLWKKITLLTALGLIFGVAVFSSLGMRAVDQATETMLEDRLTTARLLADYVDEALGRALAELENTARTIEGNGVNNNLDLISGRLKDTYSRLSLFTQGIYLLNQQGQVVWGIPQTAEGEDVYFLANISPGQAMGDTRSNISGLVSTPMTDTPVILLSSPTREAPDGSIGTLVVAIDPVQSSIGGFIQPIRLGDTGYVEIVDQNGIVVARTEPGPELAPFEQSDHSGRFAALIAAGEPTRGVCHTCHETEQKVARRDVLAFAPLSRADWGVVFRQAEEEALAPTRELRQNLIFFGVGLVSVALLFVVVTTRDIGTRIKMLTSASQKIAEGDLVSPVTTVGKDEVGILAQTLDDMRVKLKTSYGELEQKTRELSSLLSVSEILTSADDLPKLLDAVVTKAVEIITHADGGALLLYGANQQKLQLQCAVGLDKNNLSRLLLLMENESPSGTAAEITDEAPKRLTEESATSLLRADDLPSQVQSTVRADVLHQNKYIGSLLLVSMKKSKAFSESDRHLLQAIADYIAIAIERDELTREAEEAHALYETDRLRSQFISSVSHELRTPLTLIKGYSTSLLRENVSWDEKTQREFLQIIDEKTDELRDLIDKLLQSAKLEAGALKLEKEPVLLPRLARKIVEDTTSRTRKHHLTLEFTPSFPVIEADVRCMEQVLRNLVENAVKYSPGGGEITITGETSENEILVCVRDNGTGIPPEHRDKVFERFYRVDSALTRGASGSGLGLSISKGHIEAHGGKIWLDNTVSNGSKFCFSLPLH